MNLVALHDTGANRAGVRDVEVVLSKMAGEMCDETEGLFTRLALKLHSGHLISLLAEV